MPALNEMLNSTLSSENSDSSAGELAWQWNVILLFPQVFTPRFLRMGIQQASYRIGSYFLQSIFENSVCVCVCIYIYRYPNKWPNPSKVLTPCLHVPRTCFVLNHRCLGQDDISSIIEYLCETPIGLYGYLYSVSSCWNLKGLRSIFCTQIPGHRKL